MAQQIKMFINLLLDNESTWLPIYAANNFKFKKKKCLKFIKGRTVHS